MKTQQKLLIILTFLLLVVGLTLSAKPVVEGGAAKNMEEDVLIEEFETAVEPPGSESMAAEPGETGPDTFVFISSEMEFRDKLVKGSPYSAQAVTERVQSLSDGNRIVQKNTALIYRDSEGRTRREQELENLGAWVSADKPQRKIFINDPVSKSHFLLDPEDQTAHKMNRPLAPNAPHLPHILPAPPAERSKDRVEDEVFLAPAPPGAFKFRGVSDPKNTKTESLGKQVIEGIDAEGTRTVNTIPAGKIGNELQIEVISEKWYSRDLQVYVMTRHIDPRFGETTYRLTNINRAEPDPALFQVPEGYKIEEGPLGDKVIIKKRIKNQ